MCLRQDKRGLLGEDVILADTITSISESSNIEIDKPPPIIAAVDTVNQSREEKIRISVQEIKIESMPSECIYISIDDIGVKYQSFIKKNAVRNGSVSQFVEKINGTPYLKSCCAIFGWEICRAPLLF